MKTVLFQGDSITDCQRSRNDDLFLNKGNGYPLRVIGELNYKNPGEYDFINRGISGNRITDLYARIKSDIINLKPDYMSILIGVNDVWHELGEKNGVCAEKFEKIYNMLIEEIKEALPDIKIMILEPFLTNHPHFSDTYETFLSEVKLRAECAKRVAEKHGLVFVPLQEKFDEMCGIMPEPYWTHEGVHPRECGHEIIARAWMEGFEKLKA